MEAESPVQKISTVDTKHEAMIHDAQYDYYGKRLATCSSDGLIKIFDVTKPEIPVNLATFQAHNGPVWQVAWAHPSYGNILASCGFDKKVIVWKEVAQNDWRQVISHSEHQGSVNGISWAPWESGLKLAACSSDKTISILSRKKDDTWEKPARFQAHEEGVTAISWCPLIKLDDFSGEISPDHKLSTKFASCSQDKEAKIWVYNNETKKYECKLTLKGHKDWIRDIAWCPALGNPYDMIASCSEDQTVIIHYLNDQCVETSRKTLENFKGPVWRVSWSLAGNMLAVSSASNTNENLVHLYQENEQGEWDEIDIIKEDK